MDFIGARKYILQRLTSELSPELFYHSLEHTLNVHEATRRLNETENVDEYSKTILETAALYHDAGMLIQYSDHEAHSVAIIQKILPQFEYTKAEIDQISGLIMVTTMPQRPNNLYEQIICDADLDYLGLNDFFIKSFKLRLEWQVNGIRNTTLREWVDIQIKFLSEHQYFTRSAITLRNEEKLKNLTEFKQLTHNS